MISAIGYFRILLQACRFNLQRFLESVLTALSKYIVEQKEEDLESALADLRAYLQTQPRELRHAELVVVAFSGAADILPAHLPRPHLVFAMENVLKSAISALSNALGAQQYLLESKTKKIRPGKFL